MLGAEFIKGGGVVLVEGADDEVVVGDYPRARVLGVVRGRFTAIAGRGCIVCGRGGWEDFGGGCRCC